MKRRAFMRGLGAPLRGRLWRGRSSRRPRRLGSWAANHQFGLQHDFAAFRNALEGSWLC